MTGREVQKRGEGGDCDRGVGERGRDQRGEGEEGNEGYGVDHQDGKAEGQAEIVRESLENKEKLGGRVDEDFDHGGEKGKMKID